MLSGIFFAGKVSRLIHITSRISPDGRVREYFVTGQVFFASAEMFAEAIDVTENVNRIVIDVTDAHFWDISAIGAVDQVMLKARKNGRAVKFVGMNTASATMLERHAVQRK